MLILWETADYEGTADKAGTDEWAQLDFQRIQHPDYFGLLSKDHCTLLTLQMFVKDLFETKHTLLIQKVPQQKFGAYEDL